MTNGFDYEHLENILVSEAKDKSRIISILQSVQEHWHYLPREIFPYMAESLNVSEAHIYSVATFYENFSLDPKGRFVIRVCDGTACHVRHSTPILEKLREELSLSESKKTDDKLAFTVETVSCLGACGLAPVITVNEKVYPAMTKEKVTALIKDLREQLAREEAEAAQQQVGRGSEEN